MKLIYSGKTKEFTPELEDKLNLKLAKLGKMIEQRGEREAHLIHQVERHRHKIEVTVNFYDHSLVGVGSDADLHSSLNQAIDKLEKQVVKLRTKWRDVHRDPAGTRAQKEQLNGAAVTQESAVAGAALNGASRNGKGSHVAEPPRVYLVHYEDGEKPQTLEEALMTIGDREYVMYQSSDRSCLSVLVRRKDGDFDLIET